MKKIELVKKLIVSTLVILYDIVSLLWCYVLVRNLIYNVSSITVGMNGLEITVREDILAFVFEAGNILGCLLPIILVLFSMATVILLTVSMFKKQTARKLHLLLCAFLTVSFIIYLLIPIPTYVISLYLLVEKMPLLKHMRIVYSILSLGAVVTNALLATRKRRVQI